MRRDPVHTAEVRVLRQVPTPAEARLWEMLRNRRLAGLKFRRQAAIGAHVAGFLCAERRLVVDVGADLGTTAVRDDVLRALGLTVVRLAEAEVLADPEGAASAILGAIGGSE